MSDEVFYDTAGSFANADKSVISWEGSNYYRACDFPVVINDDHSSTRCVKRQDHPGDIHEDYDGVRTTPEPKGRMSVVVTFPIDNDDVKGHSNAQAVLKTLKPHFADQPDVKVYGAVRDTADQIIMILEGDG